MEHWQLVEGPGTILWVAIHCLLEVGTTPFVMHWSRVYQTLELLFHGEQKILQVTPWACRSFETHLQTLDYEPSVGLQWEFRG